MSCLLYWKQGSLLAASLVGKSSAPALQPVQSGKDDFKNTSLSLMRNGGPPKVGGITYPPAKKITWSPAQKVVHLAPQKKDHFHTRNQWYKWRGGWGGRGLTTKGGWVRWRQYKQEGEEEGRGQYKGGVKTRRRVEDLGNRTRERFGNT